VNFGINLSCDGDMYESGGNLNGVGPTSNRAFIDSNLGDGMSESAAEGSSCRCKAADQRQDDLVAGKFRQRPFKDILPRLTPGSS
jgi:hypothetical protein